MAQSYFSASHSAPLVSSPMETSFKSMNATVINKDVEAAYLAQKDSLVGALDDTGRLLSDLRTFNKESWVIKYPTFKMSNKAAPPPASGSRPSTNRRSLSFADEPTLETDVFVSTPHRAGMRRSVTLAGMEETALEAMLEEDTVTSTKEANDAALIPDDLQVLCLDLNLGPHGSPNGPASLVSQLEKASIAALLDERIGSSLSHLDKLRLRVEDTSSKVLVTGDLNAGKSTFVNALLGREVMPVDQQPCTTMFCEVHDSAENEWKEEVHFVNEGMTYSREDETTFTRAQISELEGIVTESDVQRILKLYVKDARGPSLSLINNGIVDISLIDAPGLNRDSLKTTALFARQEEIDVVVFVVSAENHFTLSAKDFLWTASNEKAYLFIVVNKFDQIKDKARCKRMVLDQIKQLSPRTWDDADDLVHFVDSSSALSRAAYPEKASEIKSSVSQESFDNLESSLRSFVLVKRQKSKLLPVTTFLANLLSDVEVLAATNGIVAQNELAQATADLNRVRPELHQMQKQKDELEDGLASLEDDTTYRASRSAAELLQQSLERVSRGEVGVTIQDVVARRKHYPVESLPSYPGIFRIWDYAAEVRRVLLASLDLSVKLAEDDSREMAERGVEAVFNHGDVYIPVAADRSRLIFRPEAMFSSKRDRRKSGVVVAGGMYGLGIGLAQRSELKEVTFQDIFDLHYHLSTHLSSLSGDDAEDDSSDLGATALGMASLGLGAMTVVGGKVMGVRGLIEIIARLSDAMSNPATRKWVAPLLAAATIALATYGVLELPHAVPRSVGRNIKATLSPAKPSHTVSALVAPQLTFVEYHVKRIEEETRRVTRLAGWNVKEKYNTVTAELTKEVKLAEESEKRSTKAMEFFEKIGARSEGVRSKLEV